MSGRRQPRLRGLCPDNGSQLFRDMTLALAPGQHADVPIDPRGSNPSAQGGQFPALLLALEQIQESSEAKSMQGGLASAVRVADFA